MSIARPTTAGNANVRSSPQYRENAHDPNRLRLTGYSNHDARFPPLGRGLVAPGRWDLSNPKGSDRSATIALPQYA